jgi:hypothetical protein
VNKENKEPSLGRHLIIFRQGLVDLAHQGKAGCWRCLSCVMSFTSGVSRTEDHRTSAVEGKVEDPVAGESTEGGRAGQFVHHSRCAGRCATSKATWQLSGTSRTALITVAVVGAIDDPLPPQVVAAAGLRPSPLDVASGAERSGDNSARSGCCTACSAFLA